MKTDIIKKALRCIDEVFPVTSGSYNDRYFPTDDFYQEAVRWAVDNAPARLLGAGTVLPTENAERKGIFNDVIMVDISALAFGRLITFMVKGWATKPNIIYDTDPRYQQMSNPVLRGKPSHPFVAICDGKTRLEAYSMVPTAEAIDITSATYMPYDATYFTTEMVDIAAWRLAELVLLSTSDANAAAICSNHLQEMIQ